jgi:hypothetical protein
MTETIEGNRHGHDVFNSTVIADLIGIISHYVIKCRRKGDFDPKAEISPRLGRVAGA